MNKAGKLKGPAYYVGRIKEKMNKHHGEFDARHRMLYEAEGFQWWETRRDYEHYDLLFRGCIRQFFGETANRISEGGNRELAEHLAYRIPRNKRMPLEILDEGAGEGVFSSELKEKLRELGVDARITATTLEQPSEGASRLALEKLKREKKIDKLVLGYGELFEPKQKYHAIFSMLGSINYTINPFRKDTLLKFAYSLKRGGLLIVGFTYGRAEGGAERTGVEAIAGTLGEKQGTKIDVRKEKEGIERAFQKRGFRAKFFEPIVGRLRFGLPNMALIVQRLR